MSAQVRVWALRVAASLVLLAGLAAIGVGIWWATDLPADESELDGVAIVFGVLAGAFGLGLGVVALLVLWLARRRMTAAAVMLCVLGTSVALLGWSTVGLLPLHVSAPLLLGGLGVGGVGFGVCLGLPPVTIDSPGGISR